MKHLFLMVMACLSLPASLVGAAQPNLLLIIADDCTYRDLGIKARQLS